MSRKLENNLNDLLKRNEFIFLIFEFTFKDFRFARIVKHSPKIIESIKQLIIPIAIGK